MFILIGYLVHHATGAGEGGEDQHTRLLRPAGHELLTVARWIYSRGNHYLESKCNNQELNLFIVWATLKK